MVLLYFFFFFQAEDGIRDGRVTGVQTCALPIFTVVLLVLFNIIQPAGWRVGLVRITDVAIGFAVSLGVGVVFWPAGAAAVLRANLAAAYSRCADYVAVT